MDKRLEKMIRVYIDDEQLIKLIEMEIEIAYRNGHIEGTERALEILKGK